MGRIVRCFRCNSGGCMNGSINAASQSKRRYRCSNTACEDRNFYYNEKKDEYYYPNNSWTTYTFKEAKEVYNKRASILNDENIKEAFKVCYPKESKKLELNNKRKRITKKKQLEKEINIIQQEIKKIAKNYIEKKAKLDSYFEKIKEIEKEENSKAQKQTTTSD
jgi:hypothetical protein